MMSCRRSLLEAVSLLAVVAAATAAWAGPPEPPPDGGRVLVVYNASYRTDANGDGVQDSLEVARYYQKKRGVPEKNMLKLQIDPKRRRYYAKQWDTFFQEIVLPLNKKLIVVGTTNVDYLAICMGVPLHVQSLPAGGKHRR